MNVVHNANCIDALREYPDRYFDLIIADPPYFSGTRKARVLWGARYQKLGCTGISCFIRMAHPNSSGFQRNFQGCEVLYHFRSQLLLRHTVCHRADHMGQSEWEKFIFRC